MIVSTGSTDSGVASIRPVEGGCCGALPAAVCSRRAFAGRDVLSKHASRRREHLHASRTNVSTLAPGLCCGPMYRVAGAKRVAGRAYFAVDACVRLRMHGCTSDTCDECERLFRTVCSLFVMSCCDMRPPQAQPNMVCVQCGPDGRRVTVRRMSPIDSIKRMTVRWVLAKIDWLSSRANNVKGGRRNTSTRTVEPDAPAGGGDQHKMHAAHACIP